MTDLVAHAVTVFMAFFAIMNPIANSAAFTGLAGNKSKSEQRAVAAKALLITFVIICVFSLLGKTIFHLFGITLPALRIAGGIIVFIVGYHMLNGSGSSMHSAESSEDSDIAISPLAVPLLAGPGTIATAMNYSAMSGVHGVAITISVFFALCLLTYVCFLSSTRILALIGDGGMSIVTRLMGLILAVMGTQMVILGVGAAFSMSPPG